MRTFLPLLALSAVLLSSMSSMAAAQEMDEEDESGYFSQPEYNEELVSAKTPTEKARAYFHMGVEFYKERDFGAALVEFKRAQETAPHYKVLFNLGQTALELQDYVGALDYLTGYLSQGGTEISAERKAEVDAMITRLESLIAQLVVSVNVDDAEIFVDNKPVGKSPISMPIRVSAGRVKVTALKSGMQLDERHVDVAAGELGEVRLILTPARPEDEMEAEPPRITVDAYQKTEDEAHASAGSSSALVMGLVTGAFAVGAGTMALVTLNAKDRYNEERKGTELTTPGKLGSLRNDAKIKAWVTDGLLAATAVSALITTILLFSDDEPKDHRSVSLSVGVGEASLQGRF